MKKRDAIEAAQEKADISKQPQIVFRYINGINVRYDYTFQYLWDGRRYRQPTAIKVIIVKPVITDTD